MKKARLRTLKTALAKYERLLSRSQSVCDWATGHPLLAKDELDACYDVNVMLCNAIGTLERAIKSEEETK
jgi:hypothetical protein